MAEQRLQKFLSAAGIASRRKAEELITSGRVKVNGAEVRELGTKVDPTRDLVVVDGKPVERLEQQRYVLLYKPPGCVTTLSDPQGRRTAVDYLAGVGERVFPVGRLDYDAEGAVLFTTDGELANRLAHPRYGHHRVYLVKVKGDAAGEEGKLETALLRMKTGLRLEDGPAKALQADVHEHVEKNVWIRVVVGEGRYHLVKRLCEAVGLLVLRLFRPEFGGVSVEGLRPGRWRELSAEEVRSMKALVGVGPAGEATGEMPTRRALPKPGRRHGYGAPTPGGEKRVDAAARPRAAERRPLPSGPARSDERRDGARGRSDERRDASRGRSDERRPAAGRPDEIAQPRQRRDERRGDRTTRGGATKPGSGGAQPRGTRRQGKSDTHGGPPKRRPPRGRSGR